MKRNKKLQKIADESMSQYRNDEFLRELENRIEDKNEAKKVKRPQTRRIWTCAASSFATIFVVVMLCVFLIPPISANPERPQVNYSEKNAVSEISDLESVNRNCNEINFTANNLKVVKKYYDIESSDLLYFELTYDNLINFENLLLYVVINKNYHFKWDQTYTDECLLKNNKMKYNENYKENDLIYEFTSYGEIITNEIKIYIKYNGISLSQQSNFIPFVESLLVN